MSDKIKAGNMGEKLAVEMLTRKGFQIVARNYRWGHYEIDIIARRDNWMIFVEVKSRASHAFGKPEAFVNRAKAQRVMRAAEQFIFSTDWRGHIRFDVVAVTLGNPPVAEHFEDAFC